MKAVWYATIAVAALVPRTFAAPYSHVNRQDDNEAVSLAWLGASPNRQMGTTFGIPWPRGKYDSDQAQFRASIDDTDIDIESWATAYWPDGTLKWTGHAIGASNVTGGDLKVRPSTETSSSATASTLSVTNSSDTVSINNGALSVSFPKSGPVILSNITTSSGKVIGQNGRLLLRSQSESPEDDGADRSSIEYFEFESNIDNITISENNSVRALLTVRGSHQQIGMQGSSVRSSWLPFVLRFYLYANSDAIRMTHTLIYDGNSTSDFITSVGIRFEVPLGGEEYYDRHIRFAGVEGGMLNEAVQGITGLRRDPGEEIRQAQFLGGKTPAISTWDTRVSSRMQWIPTWADYRLSQLSPDGFTIRKRTKSGQGWINVPGGSQAGGLAYLGGATVGGIAVGLRDFSKKTPTSIDVSNATADTGSITLWLYSPDAQPLDLRPFHDDMGLDNYTKQLDALEITYEDYEPGYNTPYGIAKTSEIFIYGFDATPSSDTLAELTAHTNNPPVLIASPEYIAQSGAIGTYWQPSDPSITANSSAAQTLEDHLSFFVDYYINQASQRRWYGFLDHGDIMHTYDVDRHTWRYDVGGYAWDNSELSSDLFFWLQFLRTGNSSLYRFAETLTRHTGETDVYHLGPYRGLGTRHGVQHYADSAKQVRIAQPQYRKQFYYLSGGDERIGDFLDEALDAEHAFLAVDPRRKVRPANITYVPDPQAILLDTGLDWSALAAGWLIEVERRGPRAAEAEQKLFATMNGIAALKNGLVTGSALYNSSDGSISPPPNDANNTGIVDVSPLTAVFGLVEVIAELVDHYGQDFPQSFMDVWLDYCYYFNATAEEQKARYGKSFGTLNLYQGHSRLAAYAASRTGNTTLAQRAWKDFYDSDGLGPNAPWKVERIENSSVLVGVDEAAWLATNDAAQYGLAAIQDLALIGASLNGSYTS